MSNPWIELSDVMNQALGHPLCDAACEHDGRCSLVNGHEGTHRAEGLNGFIHCEWTDPVVPEETPQ